MNSRDSSPHDAAHSSAWYGHMPYDGTSIQYPRAQQALSSTDWTRYQPQDQQGTLHSTNGGLPLVYPDVTDLYGSDSSLHLRLQSLPILDRLASQIIATLARTSLSAIDPSDGPLNVDEELQALSVRKNIFVQTFKVYSRDIAFIDSRTLDLFSAVQRRILHKANRAVFISSLLHSQELSLFDLNRHFLQCFVTPGTELLRWHTIILLELKTQAYISALLSGDLDFGVALHELFPSRLEDLLTHRALDPSRLTVEERDFVEHARSRLQCLAAEPLDSALTTLSVRFPWSGFINEFTRSINDNLDTLLDLGVGPTLASARGTQFSQTSGKYPSRPTELGTKNIQAHHPGQLMSKAQHAGQFMSKAQHSGQLMSHPQARWPQNRATCPGTGFPKFGALVASHEPNDQAGTGAGPVPASVAASISQPSSVTGESEPSPTSTKLPASVPAARQAWRPEEEAALLAGLTEVKGQHWSRILSMYGKGGSKSEVLSHRTQIQLKDKARNLKLWHLKMGNKVPECLQGVTGDLKKRGGAKVRAALKAEERVHEGMVR